MQENMSVAGIISNLEYARQQKAKATVALNQAAYEIFRFEVALRNAKRGPTETRPLENAGDSNCRHRWRLDLTNYGQRFCSCGARLDLLVDGCNFAEFMERECKDVAMPDLSIAPETVDFMARCFGIEGAGPPPSPQEIAGALTRGVERAAVVLREEFSEQGSEGNSCLGWESVQSGGFSEKRESFLSQDEVDMLARGEGINTLVVDEVHSGEKPLDSVAPSPIFSSEVTQMVVGQHQRLLTAYLAPFRHAEQDKG